MYLSHALAIASAVLGALPLVYVFLLARPQIVERGRHRPQMAGSETELQLPASK
jgi:hypothetical protein